MAWPRDVLNTTRSDCPSMAQRVWVCCLLLALLSPFCVAAEALNEVQPSDRVHAFYYPWYGNPQTDGKYANWNHPVAVRNGPARRFPGGDDIGANYYPALGCYSTNDSKIVETHMQQLQRAHVGVISVSWWGRDSYTDQTLPVLFQMAEKYNIQINFHIEPHLGSGRRTALQVREAVVYLIDSYGDSPALYRHAERGNRPMFYVYDSYLTPSKEWATILALEGPHTIRNTKYDAVVIGLWVKQNEAPFFLEGHFDGCYTYFATDGFTYGSTLSNWKRLSEWANTHNKLFIPCVAPGYIDTRIRPWNGKNTRDRQNGDYYDRTFQAAIDAGPDLIGITSFNEWHEGTQIEPAVPKQVGDYPYLDYLPREATWYLDRTAHWITAFGNSGILNVAYDNSGRTLNYVQRQDTGEKLSIGSPLWLVETQAHGVISSVDFVPVDDKAKKAVFKHTNSGLVCSVTTKASAHFVRHVYRLEATQPVVVTRFIGLAVPPEFDAGGTVPGSPLINGDWFAGMEYPLAHTVLGGEADVATQSADCNRTLKPSESLQYSSVIGHAVSGSLRRGVLEYVEASRAREYKPFLHYNSWYDICEQGSDGTFVMDSDQCLDVMKAWDRDFIQPYDIDLACFVFDDGWDDYDTLWEFHPKRFPDGFAPQAKLAKKMNTNIGTWFSPFGGYGATKAARLKSAKRNGYETNSSGLSLSGEKYYQLLHDKCAEMITKYKVNSFKFDGVGGGPSADMEAACRLMAELRQIKPDLYINLTTGSWGSPFFLLHGDSIWRGGGDAHVWGDKGPTTHRWMNYRDGETYKNIIKQSPLFPINSLMLCGMVYSQYGLGRTSVDKTDKSFADQAYSFFATGTQLQELYMSQKVMTKPKWDILAEAVRWAHANAKTLRDTHWIGGNPYQYEVYGHASFDYRGLQKDQPYKAIVSLRNPSEKTVDYELSLADVTEWEMDKVAAWEISRKVYGAAPTTKDGNTLRMKLAPFSVELLELKITPK